MKDFRLPKPAMIFLLVYGILAVTMYFINGSRFYRFLPIVILIAIAYNLIENKFFKRK